MGDCVLARWPGAAIDWPRGFEGGIAHRLDTSTSGALLVADTTTELERIRADFAAQRYLKTYVFRAARDVTWDEHEVDRPLAHDRSRSHRMVVQRGRDTPHRGSWRPAVTQFRRLDADLWEATMRTGVMHQIRVHAAFVGLPLLGDRTYGGGAPVAGAPPRVTFYLHHVGIDGVTDPVPWPDWARTAAAAREASPDLRAAPVAPRKRDPSR